MANGQWVIHRNRIHNDEFHPKGDAENVDVIPISSIGSTVALPWQLNRRISGSGSGFRLWTLETKKKRSVQPCELHDDLPPHWRTFIPDGRPVAELSLGLT